MIIGVYSSTPNMGKTTVAKWFAYNHQLESISFATPIKNMASALLRSAGYATHEIDDYLYIPEKKNTEIIPGIGVTMRHILQTLGTDWGRDHVNVNLWVNIAMHRAETSLFRGIVIDDMRFPNELETIKAKGGIVIRVIRNVEDFSNNHASENRLDDYKFDHVFYNNRTISELYQQLAAAFPIGAL